MMSQRDKDALDRYLTTEPEAMDHLVELVIESHEQSFFDVNQKFILHSRFYDDAVYRMYGKCIDEVMIARTLERWFRIYCEVINGENGKHLVYAKKQGFAIYRNNVYDVRALPTFMDIFTYISHLKPL